MDALNISFVRGRRAPSLLGWALLVLGLVAMAWATLDGLATQDDLAHVESRRVRLQAQLKPAVTKVSSGGAAPAGRDDRVLASRVNAQLQLPWDAVLRDLDALATPAVPLLSVEAQAQGRTLRLAGEARTMADVLAFVAQVRQLPSVDSASLSGHEQRQSGAIDVVRFTLDATWKNKTGHLP